MVDDGRVGVAEVAALVASAGYGGQEPVAVGVSGLVDGVVAVDDPLSRWLPELPGWAGRVRPGQLIHHCGGLPSEQELMAAMPPARRCWDSPSVLQALASAVPLEPLGMAFSGYWSGPEPRPPTAEPFSPADQPVPLSMGDGGVWTTLQELMRWNDAFLRDELGVADLMSTLGRLDDGTVLHYAWGFGILMRQGQLVHSAGGNVPGMTGTLRRLPHSGRGIAVLTQTDGIERILRLTEDLVDRFW